MNRTLNAFIKKELAQTLRDPRMRVILFVLPMVQMTLFGFAISTEIKRLKLAVFHDPGDRAARQLTERFYSADWFLRVEPEGDDPLRLVRSGRADAALVIPAEGLTRSLARREATVQLILDASNATKARVAESYVSKILATARRGPEPPGPFQLDVRVLYNPTMESSVFLVPGVMSMILCLVTIILTSMSMSKEKERGTFEMIISAPLENWEILLGKTVPFVLIGMLDTVLILLAGTLLFDVPVRGELWKLLLAAFVFVVTTVTIGILISTISKNQQQSMLGSFLFVFPATLMSGIMFPVENMPKTIIVVAYLNPLKYFVTLLRNILLKGGDPWVLWSNIGVLLLMAVATTALSFRRFHQTLN
ncbi:MAG TPA: ABC transporter permease [Elusimicrobiota bacterium]|nr:ABC transporter permease [Elusimicrobiota bacterium]